MMDDVQSLKIKGLNKAYEYRYHTVMEVSYFLQLEEIAEVIEPNDFRNATIPKFISKIYEPMGGRAL
ncbi:MAG: hypothetical protein KRP56_04380 [Candidatus Methanogranum gryphiswaldense]|nr:MAG: hypothetical protein KRP56_04380 [Candidatus Methanogranum sp. U3.2.1]